MSTCARCGIQANAADLTPAGVCPGGALEQLPCARRELANLRSLLRSVTGKLEDACTFLDPGHTDSEVASARESIVAVLEVLS